MPLAGYQDGKRSYFILQSLRPTSSALVDSREGARTSARLEMCKHPCLLLVSFCSVEDRFTGLKHGNDINLINELYSLFGVSTEPGLGDC